ncbi:MAG: rod shape-determining protein MreD [Lachnospiraceae bacterium]|nr:rod shape-determining protein MreD [Lachnospiraceae bacterium]MDY5741794.1 rod shape-determining protein MreD [Lachnospiraceae bacterium]
MMIFVLGVMVILSFLLQSSVLPYLAVGGITPNLLLVLTASFGLIRGKKTGLLVGFFSGVLVDIFFGPFYGFNALMLLITGYLCGHFHYIFYEEDIKLPMITIVAADFLYGVVQYMIAFFLRGRFDIWHFLWRIIIPEVIYTLLLTIIFYPFFLSISRYVDAFIKRRENRIV